MSLPTPIPVEVNFNVEIDAESKVQLFGETFVAPPNVIVAEYEIPATALYEEDASGASLAGLIELYEPSDAQGDIKCTLAHTDSSGNGGPDLTGFYQVAAKRLARGFEEMLCGNFDCSGAAPYDDGKYDDIAAYTTQRDFGRVALGMMAHYLFGHVDATAAITNDKAYVEAMLSLSAEGDNEDATSVGRAARYGAWTKAADVSNNAVEAWSFASTMTDANLALRLVESIVKKGKASSDVTSGSFAESSVSAITNTATDATLANIVKQVIGQDSSRANNVDGSQRTRDQRQLLRFYAGDVIYVNIKVKKPTVEVTGSGAANEPANTLVTEQSYAIKITLA
jgi:hypothetical protein